MARKIMNSSGGVAGGLRRSSSRSSLSTPREVERPELVARSMSRPAPSRPTTAPTRSWTGGGGGGGGARSASASSGLASFLSRQEQDEQPGLSNSHTLREPEVTEPRSFRGSSGEGRETPQSFNFLDDLGAFLTTPSSGVKDWFTGRGIAGAAQRKADDEAARADAGIVPGKVPTNEQLEQVGNTSLVNIDGDLVPKTGSPGYVAGLGQRAEEADERTARDEYQSAFSSRGPVQVRELSQEEWAALSPEQQRGVIANFALYEASLADQALGEKVPGEDVAYADSVREIFGERGGSDTYAPNTVRVLQELGYQNQDSDLDLFLDGRATATLADIQQYGQNPEASAGARGVFADLASSDLWSDPALTQSLERGVELLDAIRWTGSLSQGPSNALSEEQMQRLGNIFNGMALRSNQGLDAETAGFLNEDIEAELGSMDRRLAVDYLRQLSWANDENPDYISFDEFTKSWLEARK